MTSLRFDPGLSPARLAFDAATAEAGDLARRLASGLRVERAADDAAGLAIATDLSARVRSSQVVRRNVADGLSALQVADGGLGQIGDGLIRLRELATQAASGPLTDDQRALLDVEVGELLAQIDQTAASSRFGDRRLLAPYRVAVGILLDTSASMGGEAATLISAVQDFQTQITDAGLQVTFGLVEVDTGPGKDPTDGTARLADLGDPAFATELQNVTLAFGAVDPYTSMLEAVGETAIAGDREPDRLSYELPADERHLVYVTDTGRESDLTTAPDTQADVAAALAARGVAASVVADPANFGDFSQIAAGTGGTLYDKGDGGGSGIPAAFDALAQAIIARAPTDDELAVQVGLDGGDGDRLDLGLPLDATHTGLGLGGLSIATQQDARDALAAVDAAIEEVAGARAQLGGLMHRLQSADATLQQGARDMAAARGRIRDLDVAEGTARLAAARVRSQSAATLLGQAAAQSGRALLSLLQG